MKKPPDPRGKYFLRDLYQEITLYDRKIAYLDRYGAFAPPQDREEAANKWIAERAPLEKTARQFAASGVEYRDEELPQVFRPEFERQHRVESQGLQGANGRFHRFLIL